MGSGKYDHEQKNHTKRKEGKSPEEKKKQWFTHFRNLLGTADKNPPIDDIPPVFKNTIVIEDGVFTLEELKKTKKQLRFGWAPGEDGIMPDLLKVVDIDNIILRETTLFTVAKRMFFTGDS